MSIDAHGEMCPTSSLYIKGVFIRGSHLCSSHFRFLERERNKFVEREALLPFPHSLQTHCSASGFSFVSLNGLFEGTPSSSSRSLNLHRTQVYVYALSKHICCILCHHLARLVGTSVRDKLAPEWRAGIHNSASSRP